MKKFCLTQYERNQSGPRKILLPLFEDNLARGTEEMNSSEISANSSSKQKDSIHQIPLCLGFSVIILFGLLYGGVYLIDRSLPNAYTINDEVNNPEAFIAERAQIILKGLTDIGPRRFQSSANEVEAIRYLNDEITKILQNAHNSFEITVNNQVTREYVQNIIIKVAGKIQNDSILVNAHFDSVAGSPGACDDGIMISVMLETLRKLTQREKQYERNIIFLLNGAEEVGLKGSIGFVREHPWIHECRTIINLEAAGHGGKAILFQTGPRRSSALMSHYVSVPHPFAQAAGEEIFQNRLIPSDTDFRIFRDYGHLNGFDIAFIQNGYRYHTKYDNFEDLELGSFQHIGDNLLALVKSLALDPVIIQDDDSQVVYFDVFNWFIICYSTLVAYIENIAVAICSFLIAIVSVPKLQNALNCSSHLYLGITSLAIIGSWLMAAGIALFVSLLINFSGISMMWYGRPTIIFGLYVAPIFSALTGTMWIFNRYITHHGRSLGAQSQIQMHITRLIWSCILLAGTLINLRSIYVVLIPVLFNTIAAFLIYICKWQHSVRKWQICSFIFAFLPTVLSMYFSVEIFSLFIPIMNYKEVRNISELYISLLTIIAVLQIVTHYIHFLVLIRNQYWIPVILFIGFAVTFIIALTPALQILELSDIIS